MKNKHLVISLVLCLIFSFATVNVLAAENLELDQAVQLLLENNRTLKNSRKDIENAEKDIDLAIRSYFPTLDLQSSYTKFDEKQPAGFDESYKTSISLSQTLWTGGKVPLQKEIANYSLEMARAEYEQTLEEKTFSLIETYYGVLKAKGLVEIREEALAMVNEHLRLVENRLEAGTAIKRDLLQSKIEKREAEKNLTAAKNDLKIAQRRLAQILAADKIYQPVIPDLNFNLSLEQQKLFETAVENEPQLLILELNKKIIKLQQKLEGQYYRPSLALNGSYDWQGEEFMDQESWKMTLGLNVPLYDGGKGGIKAEKQKQELEKVNNQRQDLLENLDIEVEDSILTVQETKEAVELEKLSLENAAENLEIANKSYAAGVVKNKDVIDAQSTYNQAQIALLQAGYDYEIELFRTIYNSGRLKEYFEDVIDNGKK